MPGNKKLLRYIDRFWDSALTTHHQTSWGSPRNLVMHLGRIDLPHDIVSPNNEYFAGTQYYWDSYFTIIGLLEAGKIETAKGMVDNLVFLYGKFGFIPARNSYLSVGRSQPPLLTRMAWEVYAKTKDDLWFDEVIKVAQKEYLHTWNSERRFDKQTGLSRYRPWALRKILTTYESGWDVSSRFAHGQTHLLPVDLNCLLFRYEKDIEAWCKLRKKKKEAVTWQRRAEQRRSNLLEYCWDKRRDFFFDYNTKVGAVDGYWTLAGFFPLWAGIATRAQAAKCVANLDRFKQAHGVATSDELPGALRQWDYPNSWAPLQLILVEGLEKYGYRKDASELTKQWLKLVEGVFAKTHQIWEKYDVVNGDVGKRGRYPTQSGFAWTIGVYLRLRRISKSRER